MLRKNLLVLFLAVGIIFIAATYSLSSEDIPLLPPAKLAGHVHVNGQIATASDGYSVIGIVNNQEIKGSIDSAGRYSILIQAGQNIKPGDAIQIMLSHNGKEVSPYKTLKVPEFGEMQIINLEY
jgi:ribosomal 50S subunit-recycling heat shock protein